MTVFVDTSALLALIDGHDECHARALVAWASLADADALLITTNFVILETVAVAQHRLGLDAVRTFAREVTPLLDVVFIDEGLQQAAVAALLAAGRRRLSLVDCASFEVMRRRQIGRAFAYDAHFTEQGFGAVE